MTLLQTTYTATFSAEKHLRRRQIEEGGRLAAARQRVPFPRRLLQPHLAVAPVAVENIGKGATRKRAISSPPPPLNHHVVCGIHTILGVYPTRSSSKRESSLPSKNDTFGKQTL